MSSLDSPRRRKLGDPWHPPVATPPGKKTVLKVVFTRRIVRLNLKDQRKDGVDGSRR